MATPFVPGNPSPTEPPLEASSSPAAPGSESDGDPVEVPTVSRAVERETHEPTKEASAVPVETLLVSAAIGLFLAGTSLGAAIFLSLYDDLPRQIIANAMPRKTRDLLLATMAGSGALACLVPGAYLVWRRNAAAVARVSRWSQLASPLLLAFLVPVLFDWRAFVGHELLLVIAATLFGLGLERSFGGFFRALPAHGGLQRFERRFPRLCSKLPALLAGALIGSFCVYFSYYTVLQHLRLMTYSWDMAIFDNMMWNLIRGDWFKASPVLGRSGSHIQYHATFGAYFFAPFYALYQKPETLLALQATLAGLGALPLYLVAKQRLASSWQALLLAYAYLIHGPLHSPLFYDFHFFTTAPFWIGWVIYCFEKEKKLGLVLCWIAALLIREELSAGLSMVALMYLLSGRRARWALLGGVLSATYFVVTKFVIMPLHRSQGPDSQTFAWIFGGLIPPGESGFNGVLRTIVSNPIFTLNSLLELDKLIYALKTFGPLLLLPLRHRLTWVLFVPGMLFTLLATGYKPLIETYFQYTSNYNAYLFFAAAIVVGDLRDKPQGRSRAAAALTALVAAATVFSYHHGAIFQRNSFRGGFHQVRFERSEQDKRRYRQLYELIAMIPPTASVTATEMEASHVSGRENCFTMRFGYSDADFLLVNLDEVAFGESRTHLLKALATGKYGFVASRGRFALWSNKAQHDKDHEGNRLVGLPAPKSP